jgi:hypothetical protein
LTAAVISTRNILIGISPRTLLRIAGSHPQAVLEAQHR